MPAVTELSNRRHRKPARFGTGLLAAAAALVVVIAFGLVSTLRSSDQLSPVEIVIASADAQVVSLTDESGQGTLRVIHSADRSEVAIVGNGLEALGPDMTYQLWSIGESVTSAGVFKPVAEGTVRAVISLESAPVGKWGVTIERAGGSDQPTTDLVFASGA